MYNILICDDQKDIVNALKNRLKELDVKIINERAEKILTDNSSDKPFVIGVKCGKNIYKAEKIILCSGGKSYPGTGSTGDGYKMAKELGHSVTELKPSLVPINTEEDTKSMMGLSLKNVTLTLKDEKNKALYQELGEMLFTHFGVSGPLVLSASAFVKNGSYKLYIDLKPALDEKKRRNKAYTEFYRKCALLVDVAFIYVRCA